MKIIVFDSGNHIQLITQPWFFLFKKCTDVTFDDFLNYNCFVISKDSLNECVNRIKFFHGSEPIILEADSKQELWNKLQEITLLKEII